MSYPMTSILVQEQQKQQAATPAPYSGQWTKEEQDYVAILVEGFKESTLDIPDGTSLRFFIAAKLGCKPKRVSKKYERTGYNGKQVYRRDSSVPEEKQQDYSKRLKDLEQKFKESRALVVSIQEAKVEDTSASKQSAQMSPSVTSAMSPQAQLLEERLIAMRSQIDQRAAGMIGMGLSAPRLGSQASLVFPGANMLPRSSFGVSPASSNDVIETYMRRAAMNNLMNNGMMMAPPQPSAGADPSKLLLDLYRRRQQLAMAAGVVAGINDRMGFNTSMANITDPSTNMLMNAQQMGFNKRGMDQMEGSESQMCKRPRAA